MKVTVAVTALCFLLLISSFLSEPAMAASSSSSAAAAHAAETEAFGGGGSSFCGNKCRQRCARAGVMDRCIKYCNICCQECRCVPSGTYGNKHECPCYRDKRSSKGKPKCP